MDEGTTVACSMTVRVPWTVVDELDTSALVRLLTLRFRD
jgi:hypothetical protein